MAGVLLGDAIVDPERLGIDVIFAAAMAGLAVVLITGRRELVAAVVGAIVGVGVSLAVSTTVGVIAGGVVGPAVGLLVPAAKSGETAPIGSEASAEHYGAQGYIGEPKEEDA
jgi:predicted branched-subunit amino acid permease